MADPFTAADDLAGLAQSLQDEVPDELGRQMDASIDRMRADTARDRGVTAASYRHEVSNGGMNHVGYSDAQDKAGRYVATVLEFGGNDGQPDAVVAREAARARKRLPGDVLAALRLR